ncbi:permease [Oceanidesulfovibrio marinus]|uniref:Permease n=1 Tax=Oceanidesulfovibrio marinus TaxID=370038 RepID=A0ABX6NKB8_9BACT|nr:permease [Oceanidesulfovibrio marinus]QJT11014.1 permease [Oceanidesulfovibrio marinus]
MPAVAGLREQGASKGAAAAFLTATPETGVDSVAVTWIILDPIMAVLRPLAAVLSAVLVGLTVDRAAAPEKPRPTLLPMAPAGTAPLSNPDAPRPSLAELGTRKRPALRSRLASGLRYGFLELAGDVGPWFLVGVAVAGAVAVLLPAGFVEQYVGGRWGGYLLALLLSLPIYVCATASTPMAAAFAWQGLSPGAALVFLLAGPATNIAALTVTARILGKRETIVYLAALVVCALLMGVGADALYGALGATPTWSGGAAEEGAGVLDYAAAAVFLGLCGWSLLRKRRGKSCG